MQGETSEKVRLFLKNQPCKALMEEQNKTNTPNTPAPKNTPQATPRKRTFEIRTMAKDLERLTGNTPSHLEAPPQKPSNQAKDKGKIPFSFPAVSLKPIVVGGVLLIIFLIIGGLYFFLTRGDEQTSEAVNHAICENNACTIVAGTGEDQCAVDEDCGAQIPSPPSPLLPVSQNELVILEDITHTKFRNSLSILTQTAASGKKWQESSLIALSFARGKGAIPETFLAFEELYPALNIRVPNEIRNQITGHSFFMYIAGAEERKLCENDGNVDVSCSGARILLALKFSGSDKDMQDKTAQWEEDMISNLEPLILFPYSQDFQTARFQDFTTNTGSGIRFLNFKNSASALNYSITEDLLLIGTSKKIPFWQGSIV